jgi:protein-S-isoprenylcysteine O-methyltransferase Ste14
MNKGRTILNGAIVLYFIIGLEILIMISPFAGFFYSAFNPVLLVIANYPATRWLSAFFLPHMVVPPDAFLKVVRVAGSVLFLLGLAMFFVCAFQVYFNKIFKKGTALKGLYSVIRHPQYLGLAIAGAGLSILWPRFLVVALWVVMVLLYLLLAKDEERRMVKDFPEEYRAYMEKTGMFLPRSLERHLMLATLWGKIMGGVLIAVIAIGGAFALRFYTIRHLDLWSEGNVAALSITSDDLPIMQHRMPSILDLDPVKARLQKGQQYLVYFLPANYIMQGLIADTGGEWKLYKQHHAVSMITDWIFHPFRHLSHGHHSLPGNLHQTAGGEMSMARRLIFLRIDDAGTPLPYGLFAISAHRIPVFMLDMDVHSLKVLSLKDLPRDTGWGTVPTPVF